jgi:hypothetical protein
MVLDPWRFSMFKCSICVLGVCVCVCLEDFLNDYMAQLLPPVFTFILSHKNTTFHLFCTCQVLDSNDCPPVFSGSAMKMKIGEGIELVGEEILQGTAFDEDEPGSPNSVISYRLLNDSPEFRMDDKTGTIGLIRD